MVVCKKAQMHFKNRQYNGNINYHWLFTSEQKIIHDYMKTESNSVTLAVKLTSLVLP